MITDEYVSMDLFMIELRAEELITYHHFERKSA
jgi:hypothetical protein